MMKNDSCTLKIGPIIFLFLQRILCKRHFHYWPQKEEELHFFQTNEKNIIMGKEKKKRKYPIFASKFSQNCNK